MHDSGLGQAGIGGLAIVGVTYAPLWQVAIVLGVIVAGGVAVRFSSRLRRNK